MIPSFDTAFVVQNFIKETHELRMEMGLTDASLRTKFALAQED